MSWFVETTAGTMEPVHNLATAQFLAREQGTRYYDAYSKRFFTPQEDEDA